MYDRTKKVFMEIWNHFAFRTDSDPLTTKYTLDNGIICDLSETLCAVDISENDPRWRELEPILKAEKIFCLSETKFSKEELYSAEWLTVRSRWLYDYPQPEDGYCGITYTEELLCLGRKGCGRELVQKNSFRFKKTPKWGRRNFCMTNWVYDEFFVSPKTKELLESSDLQGFSFLPVYNKSGREVLADIDQMQILHVLPEGIADFTACIDGIYNCPVCGKRKYFTNGRGQFVFKKEIFFDAPDFVKSAERFGYGHIAARLILVNQKAHRFITSNKLDSSLVFEPICLV